MTDPNKKLENIVNSSGFPLQIGIEHQVKTTPNFGWRVLSSEHPWLNESSGNNGFIDVILEDRSNLLKVIVIECKRVLDTYWIFLIPSKRNMKRSYARYWWTDVRDNKLTYFDWYDSSLEPESPVSEFCVVPGQDSKRKPMLERIATELIESTESIAHEEYNLHGKKQYFSRVYFSVIVTTAEIKICNFDPDNIDIRNGKIKDGDFQTVPFVRFRKSLTTEPIKMERGYNNLKDIASAKERTIFVINSNEFINVLEKLKLP